MRFVMRKDYTSTQEVYLIDNKLFNYVAFSFYHIFLLFANVLSEISNFFLRARVISGKNDAYSAHNFHTWKI